MSCAGAVKGRPHLISSQRHGPPLSSVGLSPAPSAVRAMRPSDADRRRQIEAQLCGADLVTKACALEFDLDGTTVTMGGFCKGSGMIHPNMATMLGLVTCDAAVDRDVWTTMLQGAIKRSFNAVRAARCEPGWNVTGAGVTRLGSQQRRRHGAQTRADMMPVLRYRSQLTATHPPTTRSWRWPLAPPATRP